MTPAVPAPWSRQYRTVSSRQPYCAVHRPPSRTRVARQCPPVASGSHAEPLSNSCSSRQRHASPGTWVDRLALARVRDVGAWIAMVVVVPLARLHPGARERVVRREGAQRNRRAQQAGLTALEVVAAVGVRVALADATAELSGGGLLASPYALRTGSVGFLSLVRLLTRRARASCAPVTGTHAAARWWCSRNSARMQWCFAPR